MTKYSYVMGRFQIPTLAHIELFKYALSISDHLIIGLGSTNLGRSLKNPFTAKEREILIANTGVPEIDKAFEEGRITFIHLEDSPYSDMWWVEHVQRQVKSVAKDNPVTLVGCEKDDSSYYLKLFPQWEYVKLDKHGDFNATDCRRAYYEFGPNDTSFKNKLHDLTTPSVVKALQLFPKTTWQDLHDRWLAIKAYREEWGEGPFYTADAVVVCLGHALVITRADDPFNRGKYAFAGGFRHDDEFGDDAAVRELEEETGLSLTSYDWADMGVFDKPDRDERAMIETEAFLFNLRGRTALPEVRGQDDAESAQWVPLADLRADNMYADHYFILRRLLAEQN